MMLITISLMMVVMEVLLLIRIQINPLINHIMLIINPQIQSAATNLTLTMHSSRALLGLRQKKTVFIAHERFERYKIYFVII